MRTNDRQRNLFTRGRSGVGSLLLVAAMGCRGGDKGIQVPPSDSTPAGDDSRSPVDDSAEVSGDSAETAGPSDDSADDKPETIVLVVEGTALDKHVYVERTIQGEATIAMDGASLTGTVHYVELRDGELLCDERIAVSGLADSGWCPECDFRFVMDGVVTDHGGTDACVPRAYLSSLPNDYEVAPVLGFAAEDYPLYLYYGWEPYDNVLLMGAGFDHHYYDGTEFYDPSPAFLSSEALTGRWFSSDYAGLDGDILRWDIDKAGYQVFSYYYADCHTARWSGATQFYDGTAVYGDLPCNPIEQDGWSIDVEAGDTLTISVDLIPPAHQDNPRFHVNGPGGCGVVQAWNNFKCSTDDSELPLCPSASFVAPTSGTYTTWVYSSGYLCGAGTTFDYKLSMNLR